MKWPCGAERDEYWSRIQTAFISCTGPPDVFTDHLSTYPSSWKGFCNVRRTHRPTGLNTYVNESFS